MLIELGLGESGSSDVAALGRRWQPHGAAVQHLSVRVRVRWFVPSNWGPEDDDPDTAALVDGISRWVVP